MISKFDIQLRKKFNKKKTTNFKQDSIMWILFLYIKECSVYRTLFDQTLSVDTQCRMHCVYTDIIGHCPMDSASIK